MAKIIQDIIHNSDLHRPKFIKRLNPDADQGGFPWSDHEVDQGLLFDGEEVDRRVQAYFDRPFKKKTSFDEYEVVTARDPITKVLHQAIILGVRALETGDIVYEVDSYDDNSVFLTEECYPLGSLE